MSESSPTEPAAGDPADQVVRARLRRYQEKLLDLTKRNRLLNFRVTRASTVRIVGEAPADLFDLLVRERKPLTFLPQANGEAAADPAEPSFESVPTLDDHAGGSLDDGDAGMIELPAESAAHDAPAPDAGSHASVPYSPEKPAPHHRDLHLQTDLDARRLDHNLRRIHQQAASSLEEQGYNTLYLALGGLEWFDPASPQAPLIAPILLVPVELRRSSPRRPFQLFAAEEDPLINPALVMKLDHELPRSTLPLADDPEEWDVSRIFAGMAERCASEERWRVRDTVFLALLSFTKFTMYKDLETFGALFGANALIRQLCGAASPQAEPSAAPPAGRGAGSLDQRIDPESTFQVLDADSSQQEAILTAMEEGNLVLEGPPGTGKSQTIANLIAEYLARGRRVLFVSEKMAALEVVFNRLRNVGLGDFCLELHSRHTSKRKVVEELARTLALKETTPTTLDVDTEKLVKLRELRDRLNRFAASLSHTIDPLGLSPREAMARSIALDSAAEVVAPIGDLSNWNRARLEAALDAIRRLEGAETAVRRRFPDPLQHPWRGSHLEELTYAGSVEATSALDGATRALEPLCRDAAALASNLRVDPPPTIAEAVTLARCAELLARTPRPPRESVLDPEWSMEAGTASRLTHAVRQTQDLRARALSLWREQILVAECDVAGLLDRARSRSAIASLLSPTAWRDKSTLRGLCRQAGSSPPRDALVANLEAAMAARAAVAELGKEDERGRRLFGGAWRGADSDPDALQALADWSRAFVSLASGASRDRFADLAVRGLDAADTTRATAEAVLAHAEALRREWERLRAQVAMHEEEALGRPFTHAPLADLSARFAAMRGDVEALHDWSQRARSLAACGKTGTAAFVAKCASRGIDPAGVAPAFERFFLRCWLDFAFSQRPELRQFSRAEHERAIDDFRRHDIEQLRIAQQRLRSRLLERIPDSSWKSAERSELGVLQREVRRKRGHMPIRKLFQLIPGALAQLKPCFLMSPLSVAQFLDPGVQRFDVVVFDEASQIAPEDALGAVTRGSHLVVVGDSKQLPPTSFFHRQGLLEDADEDTDESPPDLESILDECVVAGFPRRMLRWHYRSRHESLIAFSNRNFYGDKLHTFPGPGLMSSTLGVHLEHLPDAVYDRGKTQTNPLEARRVAEAVLEHFRTQPNLSLGVGAFSQAQQLAIIDELETLRRKDESLEELFSSERSEHFFVKNLENIQGDERDVIFLSVGYGRDAQGALHLNFGPLNTPGGERRLNVLVTRARRRLVVYSSILGSDIDESRTSSIGVLLLKRYLEYAAGSGKLDRPAGQDSGQPRTTPVESSVRLRLEGAGFRVEPEIGSSLLRLDLAVAAAADGVEPSRNASPGAGGFFLGVDADGAGYAALETARERDRLRQQILEGLGWSLYRIWTPEWFRNPQAETQRLLEAGRGARDGKRPPEVLPLLEELRRPPRADAPLPRSGASDGHTRRGASEAKPAVGRAPLYEIAELGSQGTPQGFEQGDEKLLRAVSRLVEVEAPIHREELTQRIARAWGIGRVTRGVEDKVREIVARAESAGALSQDGEFLWRDSQRVAAPRRREGDEAPREAHLLAIEEIAATVRLVLEMEFRLSREDLAQQAARILGLSRSSARLRERVEEAIDGLITRGEICAGDQGLSLAGGTKA